ncbi:MAG: phosphate ABC transporter substrate-binding protein [Ignavibacteria bacterium]|nr:phosphate ABC transporter substrate-binding protein [Ignavibacteria bacterium]
MKKLLLFIIITIFYSCSHNPAPVSRIIIKGSDTILPLVETLAREYMKRNETISIYVEGGGTALGIKTLSRGESDICTASRLLTAEENKTIAEKYNALGVSVFFAKDALSIYINPENKIRNFSIKQLKDIFSGKIKNWKELGGKNLEIIPVTRTPNSGTYLYFKDHILQEESYIQNSVTKNTTKEIADFIIKEKAAIGYGGIGYKEGQTLAAINNIYPSEKTVINGTYPIVRYLYFITINNPQQHIKKFIDWTISTEGQQVIRQSGLYFPIWEKVY